MECVFSEAAWIWYTETAVPDTYGDFVDRFYYRQGKVLCRVSCDGDYTLFVNGHYASSNQYGDFEHAKSYDTVDLTPYLSEGENTVLFTVWHVVIASSRYRPAAAGLLYEIERDGALLCGSGENTLCRENPYYKGNYRKIITAQLGQSFLYDATAAETPFYPAIPVKKKCTLLPRPVSKSSVGEAAVGTVLKAEKTCFLVDLGEERVGLPILHLVTDQPQKITVCWGERLDGGHVPRRIGKRDFSFEYVAHGGENRYVNYMLRLGCRYLELFCEAPVQLKGLGLLPQEYPVRALPMTLEDPLDQRIYDLCVRTLKLCLMEHYVDTPWREQAFYVFDGRNQMRCGYRVFEGKNAPYAAAALRLIAQDRREDGLLSITYPGGTPLAIPSFSLHYFTAVREYLEETDDLSLGYDVFGKLQTLLSVFRKQKKASLLYSFPHPSHWNFYDWSPHLQEEIGATVSAPDLVLNCLYLLALGHMTYIARRLRLPFEAEEERAVMKKSIKEAFWNEKRGLFSMTVGGADDTALGNALAILAGVPEKNERRAMAEALVQGKATPCSLSMKGFLYDALLRIDPAYQAWIKEDIHSAYRPMVEAGATTVWEVKEGAEAFDGAGSLCHGWSAIPILYL